MAVYHGVDGTVLAVSQVFTDDEESPLIPAAGYPKVRLVDSEGDLLVSVIAVASSEPGKWTANIPVPKMKLEERKEFRVKWRFLEDNGSKHTATEVALIEPSVDQRVSDIVAVDGSPTCVATLPVSIQDDWTGSWQIYQNNEAKVKNPDPLDVLTKRVTMDSTSITIPLSALTEPSLNAHLLSFNVQPPAGRSRLYNYKLWYVSSQIMLGMSHLEDFLNKSRIENVIPELRYTDGDLLSYLERGLYMFNRVGYPTAFNGTNMQGILFDAWLICSSYWALSAQLLAEGSLAFDFNGQGVSLNVDRTPQLDSALGRVESQIEQHVVPLKKLLNSQGITKGDGSVGATSLNNPASVGCLGIINANTTRLPPYAGNFFVGKWGGGGRG